MALTFHIIYTPGTVRQLGIFVPSLVRHAPECRFRLVANGCSAEEQSLLRTMAEQSDQLEMLTLPWRQLVSHGQALNWLQEREESDYFAFMDSDIFATGAFVDQCLSELSDHAALFSCPPVWSHPEHEMVAAEFAQVGGVYNRLHDGTLVGSSYFAIYKQQQLLKVMAATGVDFRLYEWDAVPMSLRDQLIDRGHHKRLYDTGKLLNLMLVNHNHATKYFCFEDLHHVGGISGKTAAPHNFRRRLKLAIRRWGPLVRTYGLMQTKPTSDAPPKVSWEEFQHIEARQQKRKKVAIYFHTLLTSQLQGERLPTPPQIGDDVLERQILQMAERVRSIKVKDISSVLATPPVRDLCPA